MHLANFTSVFATIQPTNGTNINVRYTELSSYEAGDVRSQRVPSRTLERLHIDGRFHDYDTIG
jgi:hypothetical protein